MLTAADKLEIQELVGRAYGGADHEDAAEFVRHFVHDGVLITPYGEFDGTDKIRTFMDGHIAAGKESGVKHVVTNVLVDETPSGGRLRYYAMKIDVVRGPSNLATIAGDCSVKRTVDGWRFERFEFAVDPAAFAKQGIE